MLGLAVVIVVVLGGAGAATWFLFGDGPDHPDEWDPRVADLAAFVEDERDLDFEHPVAVEFLTDEEFRAEVTADEEDLAEEERDELEAFTGVLRALGLIQGEVDLFEELNTLTGEGILAFYDPDDEKMVVRGTELTVGVRGTLVHELTHALQDQHFDLSRLDDEDATDGEFVAFQALVEGDAQRIEVAYVATLSEDEFAAYTEETESGVEQADVGDVPAVIQAYFGAPYVLGEGLVTFFDLRGGNEDVDQALRDPPTSEEHLFDPWTYVGGDEPEVLDIPELAEGERSIDEGDFGVLTWYLALAERLDPRQALEAVDGWGGDAYVISESGGTSCVRAAFVGDRPEDSDEMEQALREWSAALPEGDTEVSRQGDTVSLRSCDPGTEAELGLRGTAKEAILIPAFRAVISGELSSVGATRAQSECVAREAIGRMSGEQLLSLGELLSVAEPPAEILSLFESAAQTCVSGG